MRKIITATLAVAFVLGLSVSASATVSMRPNCPKVLIKSANHHRSIVIKKHGKRAPGRDIVKYGRIRPNQKATPARCGEIRRYRAQLKRLHTPAPALLVRTAVPPAQTPAGTLTPSVGAGETLSAIAACESGGNPATNTGNGFYGKYQFDLQTWVSVGGVWSPLVRIRGRTGPKSRHPVPA